MVWSGRVDESGCQYDAMNDLRKINFMLLQLYSATWGGREFDHNTLQHFRLANKHTSILCFLMLEVGHLIEFFLQEAA